MTDQPLVSVVVPTRNNLRTIRACLLAVRAQRYPAIELIVVDNHSSDGTAEIAAELADLALTAGPERSAQRNLGIQRAAGDWVLWLDSDMLLGPDDIAQSVRTARTDGVIAVCLPERTIGPGFWTACRTLERECYVDDPALQNPRLVARDYLLRDGFDPRLCGLEDTELRLRLAAEGQRVSIAPVLVDHDEGTLKLGEVYGKRYYYGRCLPTFEATNSGAVAQQGRDLARAYARNWRRFAADPRHAAGMALLRGVEVAAYVRGARAGRREQRTAAS